jgi:hypothetical protein
MKPFGTAHAVPACTAGFRPLTDGERQRLLAETGIPF